MRSRFGRIGYWIISFPRTLFAKVWRFAGRVGLAFRKLLTWVVWFPIFYITMPLWIPLFWLWDAVKPLIPRLWRRMGLMGLALRNLINWIIWRPFLTLVVFPSIWLYRRVLRPLTLFLLKQIWRGLTWLWQISAPRRHLWKRPLRSRWLIFKAKWRLFWKRPSLPAKAEIAPPAPKSHAHNPRMMRYATAFATVAVLAIVGFISLQERTPDSVAADNRFTLPQIIVLTPTPLPPTVQPTPTPEIILTPWPTPDPTTGGGTIAFAMHVNGNSDIYMLPVGQAEPIQLTTHPAIDRDPDWSPDGDKIAFSSNRNGQWDIFVYDIPHGELMQITHDAAYDGYPTWSADGQWLAYESYQHDNLDIYLIKAAQGENPLRITRDPAPDFAPAWEPVNGRYLAFTSRRSGSQDIFLRSLDDPLGENVINVSSTSDLDEDGAAFAANGRFLAFTQQNGTISLINAVPLNSKVEPSGAAQNLGQQGLHPAWSPDNESMVSVYHQENGRPGGGSYLVAGNAQAWGVTPQVYATNGRIGRTTWTAVNLTPQIASGLYNFDRSRDETPLFTESLANDTASLSLLYELPINAPSPYLSDQVDQSFIALRERMIAEAGWDVLGRLDNMFEALDVRPLPGQDNQSWNKAGRAFDISYHDAIGLDPQIELVREGNGTEIVWRLFVQTAVQDGSMGEPLRTMPWDFRARSGDDPRYYDQGGKLRDEIPSGYYVDFTAIAADYGWQRTPSGPNWRTYFPDVGFWHYENRQGLTWDAAIRQLYLEDEITAVFGEQ